MTPYQLKHRWKTVSCKATGEKCWCRCIRTENGRSEVIGAGWLSKTEAEYFVKLHNKSKEKKT